MKLTKKILLEESMMPTKWYNIVADMENKPLPLLNPKSQKPVTAEDLEIIFPKAIAEQELSTERWIDIPEEVYNIYKIYRPTPLVRASGLEKALDTPAKIYFKNESVSPVGSHKLNTAVPQAYYNAKEGVKHLTTETGAGQWGSSLSIAGAHFGLDVKVFMVKNSYYAKPYRQLVMKTYGGEVFASPSEFTQCGRDILAKDPECGGSLGIAISEAVEVALNQPNTKYALGSVLNHVILHQTIIGLEAEKQMEIVGDFPDKIIACFGGGSNMAGITFPFLRHKLSGEKKDLQIIAAEPAACPKLSCGEFKYDFGDSSGLTPMIPMYTLGHDFQPSQIHAAGLRYHGAGQLVSQLRKDGFIDAVSIEQQECFDAGILFSRAEGIIPAPESTHAIATVIREALKAKEAGKEEVILFNLSGHGLLDMKSYEQFI